MKNVLDHRILIPKSPGIVWQYLSDLSNNVSWQVDCKQVSFITSRHSGVGVRWRYQASDKRDRVVETTAWYEGLGYEYSYIEGTPFQENRGRIRLQEIPEGTVVQWTFSYDTKGFLGGVRNTLNYRRQTENVMMDSLRMLWRKLNQSAPADTVREVKSLMRDAPGYEERSRYKPRHPSKLEAETQEKVADTQIAPVITEPPISDEDTRPSIRVTQPEPEFLSQVVEASDDLPVLVEKTAGDESSFVLPEAPVIAVVESYVEAPGDATVEPREPQVEPVAVENPVNLMGENSPQRQDEPEPSVMEAASVVAEPDSTVPTTEHEKPVDEAVEIDFAKEPTKTPAVETPTQDMSNAPTQVVSREPIPPHKLDTREISVFDIFGLPKPSESQELVAVVLPAAQPEKKSIPGRIGLRILLRRKLVKIRRTF